MERLILKLLEENRRIDGRKLNEYRKIKLEKRFLENVENSCMVNLGETKVLAGIKLGLGEPFPDKPNHGLLTVNVELSPIAHPSFEPGPPSDEAIEMARIIDRGIRSSKAIELETLCIEPGKLAYEINIDLYAINHAGNLLDAFNLASVMALQDLKLYEVKDGSLVKDKIKGYLKLKHIPLCITAGMIKDKILLDPCLEEEQLLEKKICMTFLEDGTITSIQKFKGSFKEDELIKIVETCLEASKQLRELWGLRL